MIDSEQSADGSQLLDAVLDLAEAATDLSDQARLAVLGALQGEETLAAALGGAYVPEPRPAGPSAHNLGADPVGAFLRAIRVQGFRGIGPDATLKLQPTPGLTIVAGRNGSGKSSFSEALELALTGNTYRWQKRAAVWTQHWRNIHHGTPCAIRIELAEEGVGVTTVGVDWAEGAELGDRETWLQRRGQQREPGMRGLGWDRGIELYQPLLPYEELDGLLEAGPSKLYDKLDAILGLDQVTAAQERLEGATKELREPERAATALKRDLKKDLAALDDDRANQALAQVRKHKPDIDAVLTIATGTSPQAPGGLADLRRLSELHPPSQERVTATARELREAVAEFATASVASAERAARRTNLLRQALELHSHAGDGPCPVCGVGRLDGGWRARAEQELAAEDEELIKHRQSRQRLDAARTAAREFIQRVSEPRQPGQVDLTTLAAAREAWRIWTRWPEDDSALVEHLGVACGRLTSAFEALRAEAGPILAMREDTWAPFAVRLGQWAEMAKRARDNELAVQTAQAALDFMKRTVAQLRAERMERLAAKARYIWAALRQESNVDLGAIQLTGHGNRRRVELYADVDGVETQALGVMSKGELHALVLALFLPRATVDGSPFRFLVLDDPIQAMDPAKIDGFVQVLAGLATDRQVIVFSHDDRLPQSVRQMGVDAQILEVCRDTNSVVEVTPCLDPARRYIEDAFAIAKDDGVSPGIKERVIPGLCRMAAEAAARDAYMERHFVAGDKRVDVEDAWQDAVTTSQRLALALYDDTRTDLGTWLDARPWRRPVHRAITKGPHKGIRDDPVEAVRQAKRFVADLRA